MGWVGPHFTTVIRGKPSLKTAPIHPFLGCGAGHALVHRATDLGLSVRNPRGLKVAANLADHVSIAGLLEIGRDHRLRVVRCLGAASP